MSCCSQLAFLIQIKLIPRRNQITILRPQTSSFGCHLNRDNPPTPTMMAPPPYPLRLQGIRLAPHKTPRPAEASSPISRRAAFLFPARSRPARAFWCCFGAARGSTRELDSCARAGAQGAEARSRHDPSCEDRARLALVEGRSLRLFAEGFCLPKVAPTTTTRVDIAGSARPPQDPDPEKLKAGPPAFFVRQRARAKRLRAAATQQSPRR